MCKFSSHFSAVILVHVTIRFDDCMCGVARDVGSLCRHSLRTSCSAQSSPKKKFNVDHGCSVLAERIDPQKPLEQQRFPKISLAFLYSSAFFAMICVQNKYERGELKQNFN